MRERAYPIAELTEGIGIVDGTKKRQLGAKRPRTYVRASKCVSRSADGTLTIFTPARGKAITRRRRTMDAIDRANKMQDRYVRTAADMAPIQNYREDS